MGFDVTVAVPFDRSLSEGLRAVARRCAEACPSGALALRTHRACDIEFCGPAPEGIQTVKPFPVRTDL